MFQSIDIGNLFLNIGYAGFLGFVVGFMARNILNFTLLFIGLSIVTLAYLQKQGIITVHWDAFGELTKSMLKSLPSLLNGVINTVSFSTSFAIGFALGFKSSL